MTRTLIAGNWKMNGLRTALSEIDSIVDGLAGAHSDADCLICPPATLISEMVKRTAGTRLGVGGQTCHSAASGAHTGDVSAQMLADIGASHVILGHSERRADHGETDEMVANQARAALSAGLVPIICIGESLAEREAGQTESVVLAQLAASVPDLEPAGTVVIAYEPIWAIGTGLTATPAQIAEVHAAIRTALTARFGQAGTDTPILYGGSMKPGNAAEILAVDHVNGGLIGGASLKAADLLAIYQAAQAG